MIKDQLLMKAVSGILQRSEKQSDPEKLIRTFVNTGILPQINNRNNQVIYGRRGTGKTHLLKVLESELSKEPDAHVLYLDMRTLGSTSQFSDENLPISRRCICLFRDILREIHNSLFERLVNCPPNAWQKAYAILDHLSRLSEPIVNLEPQTGFSKSATELGRSGSAQVNISPTAGLAGGFSNSTKLQDEVQTNFKYTTEDKVVFPELHKALKEVLEVLNARFYLLLDEWSSLPLDLQPYLAEFIKRAFLPNQAVVVKIASLEYRSQFGLRNANLGFLGIELGSDISAGLDIDDYFIYDRNPDAVLGYFSDILFRHLTSELPEGHLRTQHNIEVHSHLPSRLFTNRNIFKELVRASEGIPRDLINIFTSAYFDSHRRDRDSIDQKAVLSAARQWFEQDKQRNLDSALSDVLRRIVDEVIGHRKARSFLLPRDLEKHKIIQRLFDSRVLHLMQRGYADKDNPGVRYNIYTLDYGTYVDLLNTSKEPQLEMSELNDETHDAVVPFDDKRSIRRIVLNDSDLAPS